MVGLIVCNCWFVVYFRCVLLVVVCVYFVLFVLFIAFC